MHQLLLPFRYPPLFLQTLTPLLQTLNQNPYHVPNYIKVFQFFMANSGSVDLDATLLRRARQLHAFVIIHGVKPSPPFLLSRIIATYSSLQDLHSATLFFFYHHSPNDSSPLLYNALIRGYARFGSPESTLRLFSTMHSNNVPPDHFTFPFVLKSCVDLPSLESGRLVHLQCIVRGFERDLYVGTSLVDMYVKLGEVGNARRLFDVMSIRDVSSWNALIAGYMKVGSTALAEDMFDKMPKRNVVSWTAMISGYTQNGMADRALDLFDDMLVFDNDVRPNWVTIMSILPACAQSAALEYGKKVHRYASAVGLDGNPSVQIAHIAMYGKCGSLANARRCFDAIDESEKGLVAFNTMITAYASNGRAMDSVSFFEDMSRYGVRPDAITFTALLSGFSHSGLVDLGIKYFNRMSSVYAVEPQSEHYACVVDLLGRSGRLVEAKDLIDNMTIEPSPSVWGALLSACSTYRNLEIAEVAAKKLFVLEPDNSGNYILLSNMYAKVGRWDEVKELRATLRDKGVRKSPGCSWIEINGKAHAFFGGDRSHPQTTEIYRFLEDLPKKIGATGYVPDTSVVLHDVTEEEKECNLMTHSEKLAVTFGLLNTSHGSVLRVTKNLRICGDCHTFIKFISKIYSREIIVRDVNRFHHFEEGSCSCGDYW